MTDNKANGKKRERLFKSSFYDAADMDEAASSAYDLGLDAEELKKRRRRDWIFIIAGIPLFIAFMYLIVMLLGGGAK